MSDLLPPPKRQTSILWYALNRWQTATVVIVACAGIAGTIAFLEGSLALIAVWLVFGLVGSGAMVAISLRDAESIDEALSSHLDLGELRDRRLREMVGRAEAYQRAIRETLREVRSPKLRATLSMVTREMADPVEQIFSLAQRLEDYQLDSLIQQDLRRLTASRQTLGLAEQEQLASLEKLKGLMGEIEASIENALAQLGASYSAVQLARSAGELKGSAASQALEELRTQSQQLHDLNSSLDEVYGERLRGGTR